MKTITECLLSDEEQVCKVCGENKTVEVDVMGKVKYMPIRCKCEMDEYEKTIERTANAEKQIKVDRLRNFSLMDKRFEQCTFDKWTVGSKKLRNVAEKYVENWGQNKQDNLGIVFSGPVGTGKTYAVSCIANALLSKGVPVMAVNMIGLMNKIKKTFGSNLEDGKYEVLVAIKNSDLFILDDLGAEYLTDWSKTLLYEMIDERYRQKLPLIITTNMTTKKLQDKLTVDGIERIYDRIMALCTDYPVFGDSLRKDEHKTKQELFKKMMEGK